MEKGSTKYLEFQLNREKALTSELEAKCKAFHAQIAKLDQEKAELRREKIYLMEETKKTSKLDDRIHFLQKEIESRDAIIAAERARVAEASAEAEDVRRNANASIASWTAAEEQWIAEQTALNNAVLQFQEDVKRVQGEVNGMKESRDAAVKQLEIERDRCLKVSSARDAMECEVTTLHTTVDKLQNKIWDLEQTVYKLDMAGDKQKEAIDLKDTEIKTLEATVARHEATVEKLEQTISALNDRVSAAKMMNLEGKGENEKLLCDLADSEKEVQRLNVQIESLRRDENFMKQSQGALQKALEEMKEKCRQQQEDLKERNMELRRCELNISQLNVDLKKTESKDGEWSFRCSSLEAQLVQAREETRKLTSIVDNLTYEKTSLGERLKEMRSTIDEKDENLVLLQNQMEETVEGLEREAKVLEKEVDARQAVITDLTEQLASTNERNASYHAKILGDTESSGKVRVELERVMVALKQSKLELLLLECAAEKEALFSDFVIEWLSVPTGVLATWISVCRNSEEMVLRLEREKVVLRARLEKGEATLEEQLQLVSEKEIHTQRLLREISEKDEEVSSVKEALSREGERAGAFCRTVEDLRRQVSALNSEISELQLCLNLKDSKLKEAEGCSVGVKTQMSHDICALLQLLEWSCRRGYAEVVLLNDLWQDKVSIVLDVCGAVVSSTGAENSALVTSKRSLEASCRELTAFAREAKQAMSRNDLSVTEKQEALMSKVTLLDAQLVLARKEKDQSSAQLAALLGRFETEQKATEVFRAESQRLLLAERAKRDASEKEALKLRNGVNYEVQRKCEYKKALETLKRLREEGERARLEEKQRALLAIQKANGEAAYWVRCFDRLKGMIEKSRRTGSLVPSIDADTLHHLEEAKATMEGPIQARNVNAAEPNDEKKKRSRVEPEEAAKNVS